MLHSTEHVNMYEVIVPAYGQLVRLCLFILFLTH